jgi:superfamily II DNA helicase RecQ
LTTSEEVRDRHVAKVHKQRPGSHSDTEPLWEACDLQTLFIKTGDRRYFRVTTKPILSEIGDLLSSNQAHSLLSREDEEGERQAKEFLGRVDEQRRENVAVTKAAANMNPDPTAQNNTDELWMKKLGVSKYIAGLWKDEMAESYRFSDVDKTSALKDLCDVTSEVLRKTWWECQHGPDQRMTDPQAARISSFWHAADPEGKGKTFRRSIQPETLESYLRHWTQLLTFLWHGWHGRLFPQSLEAIARKAAMEKGKAGDSRGGGDSVRDDYGDDLDDGDHSGDSVSADSETSSSESREDGIYRDGKRRLKNPYIHFTERQNRCIRAFKQTAAVYGPTCGDDANRKLEALKESVLAVSKSLIQQHLGGSPFQSQILAYTAMLSVNDKYNCWEEPGSFNNHLSALIYCGQLLIFRFACDAVDTRGAVDSETEGSDDGLDGELDALMRRYFSNTVSKPLAYLLLWRRRLFGIAPLTMVNRPATWDLSKTTVGYRGISISMDEVRHLCRFTIDRARNLLYDSLMFGIDHIPKLDPVTLEENDNERAIGWWFGKHAGNFAVLEGHENVLVEHVVRTPELRDIYLEQRGDFDGVERLSWRPSAMRLYRQLVQDFLRDLAVAVHFSAGPPVRAPELLGPIWRNTEQLRHVQLRYGKVLIHLIEHKMMATTGKNVNNIRFLPDELGQLVVNYLAYPIGILESMAWQENKNASISPYLWCDTDGTKWAPKRFGDMLKAACRRAEVPEIGTAVWRHMSSAIINTHFDQAEQACFAAAQDKDDSGNDIDEDGADMTAATLVSMSNHSLRTHRHSYANVSPFANVWDGKLLKSFLASQAWAKFFGVGEYEGDAVGTNPQGDHAKRKRESTDASGGFLAARKSLNINRERHKRHWSGPSLLEEARKLYESEQLQWRCPEQERAMRLVANNAPEVLLVLATGSGKSLTFMLGSRLPAARTTILIVPLVLLRLDLIRRCQNMGLNPVVWSSGADIACGMDGSATLVFVSVEVAAKHPFRQYARRLYDTGNLERFIIDECHLILTSAHYRKHMTQLSELRQYRVPFIYMTATLPLRLERTLFQRHHMGSASVVRAGTKRPNIRYGVEFLQPPKGEGFIPFMCRTIARRWTAPTVPEWKDSRVMIFVRSCADAEEVAEQVGCSYYHRDIGTTEEKEARLKGWMDGTSGSPFLACTTAAGAGVDYPHVRWVVHIEDPYGLVDFVQESGRGGRDGEMAGSTVFMKRDPRLAAPPTPLDHPDPADFQAINEYLRGLECRRLVISRELDRAEDWDACRGTDVRCDICEAKEKRGEGRGEIEMESGRMEGQGVAERDDGREDEDGAIRYRRGQMQEQYEMDEYMSGLWQIRGRCMLCKILRPGGEWDHSLEGCQVGHKWEYIRCKEKVVVGSKRQGWMKEYTACYRCGQPQRVCRGWERDGGGRECEFRDLVMPVVWALWESGGSEREWLRGRLEVEVWSGEEALGAAGRASRMGGVECIVGVLVLVGMLDRWQGCLAEADEK